MADHTDFIRIRGLESSDTEVFQGLGAASLTVSGPGGGDSGGTSPGMEWGEIPETVLTMISDYSQELNDWIAKAIRYDEESGTRALVPELLDDLPVVPMALATVATGGLSLPAVATTMLAQVLMNHVGTAVANYAEAQDPNSPSNVLRKALIKDDKSILAEALLQAGADPSILQARLTELVEKTGNLEQPLKDLALVDVIIQLGDDLKARMKGKALEF
jgi:hypothetical protein